MVIPRPSALYLFFRFPPRKQRFGCKDEPDGVDREPVIFDVLEQKVYWSRCDTGGCVVVVVVVVVMLL